MQTPTAIQADRINQVIHEYDAQGWHRTATPADQASAHWLAGQVRAAGLDPQLDPFPIRRLDPLRCFIEIDGRRIEGIPQFDAAVTDAGGVRGVIGPAGSDATIGLVEAAPNAPRSLDDFDHLRRTKRHTALIVVTRGRRPGLAVRNAPSFAEPYGPPVLLVGSEEGGWLAERAAAGDQAHVVVHAVRTDATAYNVVAHHLGTGSDLSPLVVMTPRSGWWQCASERGGGLACWLEAMRAINERGSARDVIFVASSGHELGHAGLSAFMDRRPDLGRGAHAWIHFGANIGAAHEGGVRLVASDDETAEIALRSLAEADAPAVVRAPRGTVPNGEAHNIHVVGGRYLSLVGSNAHFHLESDRWPDAVDIAAIAAYARAMSTVASRLAS
ncbi:MAG: hypothetical protein AB7R89_25940 [Dehalococcoidia bacterium]